MAVLQSIKGLTPPQVFPLSGDRIVIGRHPDCDIVLEVGAVSRQHAQLVKVGEDYYVEDLHSRNGTFLNEQRLDGLRKLAENDRLTLCDLVFEFHQQAEFVGAGATLVRNADSDSVLLVDDEDREHDSTIMSKLDISGGTSGLRVQLTAEAKLKALLEIGRNLGGAVRLDDVLPKLLDNLFAIFIQADRGFILLRDAAGRLIPRAIKHRQEQSAQTIRLSRTIVHGVMSSKEAVLSADAASDSRFGMSESIVDFQIHSMMCAPLIGSGGHALGVIQIDTLDKRRRFGREDLELLASVACQAAVTVENAQLHEIALQEQVLQRELALAHKVQRGLLPATPPKLPGYEFFDFYEPASQLGGDYFDYVPLPNGLMGSALADVSGKGIAASLLVARLSAEVRYCLAATPTPAVAMERLNAAFCESRWEDRFVTMILAVLDPQRHEIAIVNAGHLAPLLCRPDGSVTPVGEECGGLPLGIDPVTRYAQFSVPLAPGECLVCYTDGISEAMSPSDELYGCARVRARAAGQNADATAIGRRLIDDVRLHIGARAQSDDMCLTCVRRVT